LITQHLEVAITAGPTAGQRVRLNRSPASFGRGPENQLVIDLPTVSRIHGELRYEDDRWVIANLSPNGTQLNRRHVTRKPRPLKDGDHVVVGDQPIFVISLRDAQDSAVSGASGNVGASVAPPPQAGLTPRAKLWGSILGFWLLIFALAFFFTGLDSGDPNNVPAEPTLSDADLAASIRQPLPAHEPSPRTAGQHFEEAENFYQMINADPRNTFRAYHAYKTALSYAFGDDFTDDRDDWGGKPIAQLAIAQKRFNELEQRLIADVQRLYKDALGKLNDHRYADARIAFEKVYRLYTDPNNEVYRNAQRQRDLARRRQDAPRSRR